MKLKKTKFNFSSNEEIKESKASLQKSIIFEYPIRKVEPHQKIYLGETYTEEELRACLALINPHELDKFKKDINERIFNNEVIGEGNANKKNKSNNHKNLRREESKVINHDDQEEIINTAPISYLSSEDESVIGYDHSLSNSTKRRKIKDLLTKSITNLENDSYDEDEFIFAVKMDELIKPKYVEYSRSNKSNFNKPVLKKRELKEIEKEEIKNNTIKSTNYEIEETKISRNSFQNIQKINEMNESK